MGAVKINEEKSQSWVIAIEAIVIGIIVGYNVSNAGVHGAVSLVIGIIVTGLTYSLIVYVNPIFWLWTLGLALFSGYYIFDYLVRTDVDKGWSLFWSVASVLAVIGIHVKSRAHNQAENSAKKITKLT
jgi:hypothetical protein